MLTDFVWLWVRVQQQTRQPLQPDGPALLQQRQKEPSQEAALESSKCDRYRSPRTTRRAVCWETDAEADSFGKLYSCGSTPAGSPSIGDFCRAPEQNDLLYLGSRRRTPNRCRDACLKQPSQNLCESVVRRRGAVRICGQRAGDLRKRISRGPP